MAHLVKPEPAFLREPQYGKSVEGVLRISALSAGPNGCR
jgi:hypothetical protein